jgi:6-pyruvoyltetrahydropterin/6-carboxytetrahydropterin synthase
VSQLTCKKLWREIPFAHRQHQHEGHCSLIHGHNWDVEVEFSCAEVDKNGFVIDFGKLKPLREYLSRFDHALVLRFDDPLCLKIDENVCRLVELPDASSEGLARHFFGAFALLLDEEKEFHEARMRKVEITRVTVFEDSKNSASFKI